MLVKIYNENRLTRQPFFKDLINYLAQNDGVMLRQIHRDFADVKNIDRQIDAFIAAGLVERSDKRYSLGLECFGDGDFADVLQKNPSVNSLSKNSFTAPFFVEAGSNLAQKLDESWAFQSLKNATNQVTLNFSSRYDLSTDTLFNYFHKVAENLPLTALEQEVYELIGDVDPEYALKYMTTFLLKFMRKEVVKTKSDIFIQVLEKYAYIEKISEREYRCLLDFSEQVLPEKKFTDAKLFIAAQIQQTQPLTAFISLGE